MTTTPTVWLDEFVTNLLTADAQSAPRVISLANGNFLVVWVDNNQTAADGFGTDIVGVIFDPLGNPISDSLYLNFPFGFSREEDQPDIAATPDGGFVVVYRFPTGDDTDILFGRYDDAGNRTAQDFVVSDSSDAVVYTNPSVAVADDGSFFVTYEYTNGAVNDIRGVKVSATNVVGTEQILRADGFSNGSNLEDTEDPHTVLLTNGNFATVYSENDNNGGSNERTIEVRISNADGTNFSLINNVTATDALPDSDPRIAALADGRFVVMWREGGNHNGRIFNNDGTESVAQFTISNNSGLDFDGAEIIGLEDSSFAVALIDETNGRLFVIRYNDDTPDGGSRIVSTDAAGTGGNITNLSMDLTGDGRILLSWENGEIYTEILDPRDAGSFSAEVDDGATTDRQGQSTTIIGTADNDTIYGLDGTDTLIGNGGNDFLDGGTGDDDMFGGIADDIYIFDSLGDTATEFLDEGYDKVFTSVKINTALAGFENIEEFELTGTEDTLLGNDFDTTLVANQELGSKIFANGGTDILIGSEFNDRLDGGSGTDTLTSFDGNDRLDGGTGADDMTGGDGNDRYFVDDLGDTVTELLDEGIDQVRSSVVWTLGDNVENLRLRGAANSGIGNDLDNIIQTVAAGSTLSGLGGDDNLRGSQGTDTILGGNDNDTINGRAGDDDLRGGKGDDFIKGRSGEDHLQGGSGDDELIGGKDNDILDGGAQQDSLKGETGADTFVFADGDFAGLDELTADRILDFDAAEGDVIDLSGVDAIFGGGDDAFTFIADAAFTGTAGELRFEQGGGNTMLYMDANGDGVADYAIRLDGTLNLSAADFIL